MKFTNGYWLIRNNFTMTYATQAIRIEKTEKSLHVLTAGIQRVLLDVDAGGVDVRAKDIHALAHGLAADDEQHDVLLHPSAIYTVAGNKLAARTNDLIQIPETGGLRLLHGFGNALALRLTGVQKRDIALTERFHLLQLGFFIIGPGILFVHDELPSFPRAPWHAAVPL